MAADLGTISGCRFDWALNFDFWFSGCCDGWLHLVGRIVFAKQKGGSDFILGVRCDQRNLPSTGGRGAYSFVACLSHLTIDHPSL